MSRRRGREYWLGVVADLEASGLTHREFATQQRIKLGSLRGWLYRLRRQGSTGVRMLPVRVKREAATGAEVVEIGVGGAVVRVGVGTDVGYVVELVAQLRARC